VVEQPFARRCDRVTALRGAGGRVVPLRGDELLLLEPAQEPVEVPHLDACLAGQLRQPLEQVVAVCRTLPQKEQERRLGEPLDPGEDAPAAVVMAAGTRPSHPGCTCLTCKTHMEETFANSADLAEPR